MRALRTRLSGLALPTYVLDIPGGHGKVPLEAPWISPDGDGGWRIADHAGLEHPYRDRLGD